MEAKEVEKKAVLYRAETKEEKVIRRINEVFPEEPRMQKVAWCESRYKLDAVGPDGHDHGLFQIRSSVHNTGDLNLFDLEDNLTFARKLYDQNGLSDWYSSFDCWSK